MELLALTKVLNRQIEVSEKDGCIFEKCGVGWVGKLRIFKGFWTEKALK